MSRPRILVASPRVAATFVCQDVRLLTSEFDVELFAYQGRGSLLALWRTVGRSDALLVWFVGRHALPAVSFARLRRVPVAAVIGGYEAAWRPEIGYGVQPGTRHDMLVEEMLRRANLILTVSDFSHNEATSRFERSSGKMQRIYNAVDTCRFTIDPSHARDGVLCVGNLSSETIPRKGWDIFWRIAADLPAVRFTAIGPALDTCSRGFVSEHPPNLVWKGESAGDSLLHEFQRAAVYFQGSRYESFGVAVAEAMACGCIPVVARSAALPEVVGNAGFYFDDHTPEAAAAAVRQALAAPAEMRAAARQRVVDHFDIEKRRSALCAVMRELIARHQRRR